MSPRSPRGSTPSISPPRRHLVHYADVSSPVSEAHSKFRGLMAERDAERLDACRPVPWAELLRRVFATDVLVAVAA
jgi:hypothetical protein